MDKESDNGAELVRQNDTSLFKPTAEDIFEDVFTDSSLKRNAAKSNTETRQETSQTSSTMPI